MENLTGKTAVITGAASGIGKALAIECLQRGMNVVLADINQVLLKATEQELKITYERLMAVDTDVADLRSIELLAKCVLDEYGQVDLLFNHAGIAGPIGSIWEIELEAFTKTTDTNFMGVVYGLRVFLPIMIEQKTESYIINTTATGGFKPNANMSGHNASKYAITALTEDLYLDLQQRNLTYIHPALLCPAYVRTRGVEEYKEEDLKTEYAKKHFQGFKHKVDTGISPTDCAAATFNALENDEFYIFTHPTDDIQEIEVRQNNVLAHTPPYS